jgi:multidrug resistance efflux pump
VDQLSQQVDLAIANSRLRFAETDLARQRTLYEQKITSKQVFELALDYRDALAMEIKERERLVGEMEKALTTMKPNQTAGDPAVFDTIDAAIKAQEEQFRRTGETELRAPMDGIVTKVLRNPGENVSRGESLVTISGERPENIVGFVRQPLSFEPRVGDRVIVRTRRGDRKAAEARIVKVGARMEFFSQPLRVRGFDSSQERGLPVQVDLPQSLALHPGELVDLALIKAADNGGAIPSSN